jgi:hypothetical protein
MQSHSGVQCLSPAREEEGDGSTDLQLDTSTELKMENYWCD